MLGWVVVLGLVVLVGYVLTLEYAAFLLDPLAVREWVLGFGVWAPVVFVGIQFAQVVAAPIPGQVMGFVGGYLFGVVPLWRLVVLAVVDRAPSIGRLTGAGITSHGAVSRRTVVA